MFVSVVFIYPLNTGTSFYVCVASLCWFNRPVVSGILLLLRELLHKTALDFRIAVSIAYELAVQKDCVIAALVTVFTCEQNVHY